MSITITIADFLVHAFELMFVCTACLVQSSAFSFSEASAGSSVVEP